MQKIRNKNRRGFTLIEVLIVVVILGILGATVLPQFASSTANAKESALRSDLAQIRAQIQLYKFQHDGNLPNGTNAAAIISQLTQPTDINGVVAPAGTAPGGTAFPYGPYLMNSLPANPYVSGGTGLSTTTTTPTAPVPATGIGWMFNTVTGQIISNTDPSTMKTADGSAALSTL